MSSAPITTGRPSGNDQRSPRQRIETLVYVGLGLENGGFPINVSEGGMAFQGVRPVEKDQFIHINFKLPGLSNSVESTAQIVWLNDLGKGGGLRFIDLPEGTRRVINEWLSLQTSSCGLTEDSPITSTPVETKNFHPAPDIHLVTTQDHSSAKANSSAIAPLLDSSLSTPLATKVITTSDPKAIHIHSVDSARYSGFRDPFLETIKRNAWSTPFSFGLIASLAIAGIFGVISIQFHGGLQLPTWSGKSAQPVSNSVMATAPLFSTEMQAADAPPSGSTDSGSAASAAAQSGIDSSVPSEGPATAGLQTPDLRPTKMATPLKINRPKTLSRQSGMKQLHVTPILKVNPPATEMTPPTLTPSTNPALTSRLPAQLLETPPAAPPPREPVQRSSKFDSAQLIVRKNPVYPKIAQAAVLSGSVQLHFIIGVDGYVRDVTVMKGNPLLARAAAEAVRTWRYQPARRDGVPVETESSAVFEFKSH